MFERSATEAETRDVGSQQVLHGTPQVRFLQNLYNYLLNCSSRRPIQRQRSSQLILRNLPLAHLDNLSLRPQRQHLPLLPEGQLVKESQSSEGKSFRSSSVQPSNALLKRVLWNRSPL